MQPHLDLAYWLGLLTSVVLPLLVALVTQRVTSPGVKAVLLLLLSAVAGFVVELANRPAGYSFTAAIVYWIVIFADGVLAHFGLWKPIGLSRKLQAVGARPSGPSAL